MGREEDPIWKYVSKVKAPDDKGVEKMRAKCRYCDYFPKSLANATRAVIHILTKCTGCPDSVKAEVKLVHPHIAASRKRSYDTAFDEEDIDDNLSSESSVRSSVPTPVFSPPSSSSPTSKSIRCLFYRIN